MAMSLWPHFLAHPVYYAKLRVHLCVQMRVRQRVVWVLLLLDT